MTQTTPDELYHTYSLLTISHTQVRVLDVQRQSASVDCCVVLLCLGHVVLLNAMFFGVVRSVEQDVMMMMIDTV